MTEREAFFTSWLGSKRGGGGKCPSAGRMAALGSGANAIGYTVQRSCAAAHAAAAVRLRAAVVGRPRAAAARGGLGRGRADFTCPRPWRSRSGAAWSSSTRPSRRAWARRGRDGSRHGRDHARLGGARAATPDVSGAATAAEFAVLLRAAVGRVPRRGDRGQRGAVVRARVHPEPVRCTRRRSARSRRSGSVRSRRCCATRGATSWSGGPRRWWRRTGSLGGGRARAARAGALRAGAAGPRALCGVPRVLRRSWVRRLRRLGARTGGGGRRRSRRRSACASASGW